MLTWLNRGTLHLVAAEDYPLLQALTTRPQRTANATRLAQLGIDADATARGVALIDRVLADRGPLTGAQLRESLARGGIAAVGQRLVHLLFAASLDGVLVRGPMLGADHGYARVADWLPDAGAQAAAVAADREPRPRGAGRAGTSSRTGPPTPVTWPAGRVSGCATPASGWRRSLPGCARRGMGSSRWTTPQAAQPDGRRAARRAATVSHDGRRRDCSARSSRC